MAGALGLAAPSDMLGSTDRDSAAEGTSAGGGMEGEDDGTFANHTLRGRGAEVYALLHQATSAMSMIAKTGGRGSGNGKRTSGKNSMAALEKTLAPWRSANTDNDGPCDAGAASDAPPGLMDDEDGRRVSGDGEGGGGGHVPPGLCSGNGGGGGASASAGAGAGGGVAVQPSDGSRAKKSRVQHSEEEEVLQRYAANIAPELSKFFFCYQLVTPTPR